MTSSLNLFTAVMAGLVSFLSPCVLPLVPGYISFISGISLSDLRESKLAAQAKHRAFWSSVWFVLGFTAVFVALGATATAVGSVLLLRLALLRQAAGVVVVVLGLHLIGLFRIPFLQYEKKVEIRTRPLSLLGAAVVGAAFGFGWTPCIGPLLAGILALASAQETVFEGMLLLTAYSLGLGIPFLLTAMSVERFLLFSVRFRKHLRGVEVASGLLLIAIGLLMFSDRLGLLARYLTFFNRFAL